RGRYGAGSPAPASRSSGEGRRSVAGGPPALASHRWPSSSKPRSQFVAEIRRIPREIVCRGLGEKGVGRASHFGIPPRHGAIGFFSYIDAIIHTSHAGVKI